MNRVAFLAASDEALFAGPPRAQQRGEAHHAQTLFPPPPSTFQGLVRTRILEHLSVDLRSDSAVREAVGPPDHLPPGWAIDGPWLAGVTSTEAGLQTDIWTPVPLCLTAPPGDRTGRTPWATSVPRGLTLLDDDAPPDLPVVAKKDPRGWIGANDLASLLAGRGTPVQVRDQAPFVATETRCGLSLDDTRRTAERSMLYFRETRRLSGTGVYVAAGFAAWVDTTAPPLALTSGVARLGRRTRPLALEPLPSPVDGWMAVAGARHLHDAEGSLFLPSAIDVWLILASPARFADPDRDGTPAAPRFRVAACEVEARVALLGRPLILGGLDLRTGAPRPNRAYVPAGSAWRLRIRGGTAAQRRSVLLSLHHRCVVGAPDDHPFGFGRAWVTLPCETRQ